MGVHGLWTILSPAGRKVDIEFLRNKRIAIDISIWVLKILHGCISLGSEEFGTIHLAILIKRICKLMIFGIRPVFVFDGVAPELKKNTIRMRVEIREKRHKNLKKMAEKFIVKKLENNEIFIKQDSEKNKNLEENSDVSDSSEDEIIYYFEFDLIIEQCNENLIELGLSREKFYELKPREQYILIKEMKRKLLEEKYKKYLEIETAEEMSKHQLKETINFLKKKSDLEKKREEIMKQKKIENQNIVLENKKENEIVKKFEKEKNFVTGKFASDASKYFILYKQKEEKRKKKEKKEEKSLEFNTKMQNMIKINQGNLFDKEENENLNEKKIKKDNMEIENIYKKQIQEGNLEFPVNDLFNLFFKKNSETNHNYYNEKEKENEIKNERNYEINTENNIDLEQKPEIKDSYIYNFSKNNLNLEKNETNNLLKKNDNIYKIETISGNIENNNICQNKNLDKNLIINNNNIDNFEIINNKNNNKIICENEKNENNSFKEKKIINEKINLKFEKNDQIDFEENKITNLTENIPNTNNSDIFENPLEKDSNKKKISELLSSRNYSLTSLDSKFLIKQNSNPNSNINSPTNISIKISPVKNNSKSKSKSNSKTKTKTNLIIENENSQNSQNSQNNLENSLQDILEEEINSYELAEDYQKFININNLEYETISKKFEESKEVLQLFGIPYVLSPGEAEAQCAYLERNKLVDGVISDDSDSFLFGAKNVFKNCFEKNKFIQYFSLENIEKDIGLTREKMILLALFLGSDYTLGIKGVGIVNGMEIVNAFDSVEGLKRFKEWAKSADVLLEDPLSHYNEISYKEREFKLFHRNYKKYWELPEDFPNFEIIDAYRKPNVDNSLEEFQWGKPDFEKIIFYCMNKLKWTEVKCKELFDPLKKEIEKNKNQRKIDFYFPTEKFAMVNSKRLQSTILDLKYDKNNDKQSDFENKKYVNFAISEILKNRKKDDTIITESSKKIKPPIDIQEDEKLKSFVYKKKKKL